jgi:hypothetical protein
MKHLVLAVALGLLNFPAVARLPGVSIVPFWAETDGVGAGVKAVAVAHRAQAAAQSPANLRRGQSPIFIANLRGGR